LQPIPSANAPITRETLAVLDPWSEAHRQRMEGPAIPDENNLARGSNLVMISPFLSEDYRGHINAELLARSEFEFGSSCDRATRSRSSVVFLDPRAVLSWYPNYTLCCVLLMQPSQC
jgi:hypothetical protein